MNQVVVDLWPYLVSGVMMGLIGYLFKVVRNQSKIIVKQAIIEQKVAKNTEDIQRIDGRVDRKSRQFDEIQKEVAGVREDLAEIKGDIKGLSSELNTTLAILKKNV